MTTEFQDYKAYQLYMDNNYDEEDQITIENFISYYENKRNGFGHYNWESAYQEALRNDTTGKLHEFAMIGFNLLNKRNKPKT
jgi:hypothetical protein